MEIERYDSDLEEPDYMEDVLKYGVEMKAKRRSNHGPF